ncbi:MAG: hypothetical protein SOS22_05000 [Absicoccus sp.]|uniref:hypothetical protein n=1 Tax=Absicoccus TaxID=2718525 RepID=UPI002409556A|nr:MULTISPECIES: hypothetical protein [Absicoccus]MDD6459415.1 hypothetical protein [Absicoccus porci]MDY3035558.1 hypothetical protein [Absicoccus sp.]
MQKWVLQNRNHWMVMTGIFILISFGLKMLSVPGKISTYFLIGASHCHTGCAGIKSKGN